MEHIVVAIRPGQGPGVVSWALRHARACGGGLEIIASGLEWADPHGALIGVGLQLIAAGSDVPFAMRTVAVGIPAALIQSTGGVDVIVLGSPRARLDRRAAAGLVAIASSSSCPVVIVPPDWRAEAEDGATPVTEALAVSAVEACIERLCAASEPIQIVPTSFVSGEKLGITG
jgi:nucleotide-binding universal stress UspA family protein